MVLITTLLLFPSSRYSVISICFYSQYIWIIFHFNMNIGEAKTIMCDNINLKYRKVNRNEN